MPTITTVAQAKLAEKQLVDALSEKLPTTLGNERLGCETLFHPTRKNEDNTIFCIYLKGKQPMKRYMFLVVDNDGYYIYWVENSEETFLGAYPIGTEALLDILLTTYLSVKYGLQEK